MRGDDFEHSSCHMALTFRREGPVCESCWTHGRELLTEIFDAIKELYRLSVEMEENGQTHATDHHRNHR